MSNHKFKYKTLEKRVRAVHADYPTLPFVSVGSGIGEWEKCFEDQKIPMICVDPAPQSFDERAIVRAPDYPNVAALIAKKPDIVGQCILLLIWATPNSSKYDLEAVQALQPCAIVTLYASDGAAGGNIFRRWIYRLGGPFVPTYDQGDEKDNALFPRGYQIGCSLELRYWITGLGGKDIRNDCIVVLFGPATAFAVTADTATATDERCKKYSALFGRRVLGDARDADIDTAMNAAMERLMRRFGSLRDMLLGLDDDLVTKLNFSQ